MTSTESSRHGITEEDEMGFLTNNRQTLTPERLSRQRITGLSGLGACALILWMLAAGCSDSSDTTDSLCGEGEDLSTTEGLFCVYESAVVIETGFRCPTTRPHQYEIDGLVLCSDQEGLTDTDLEAVKDEWNRRHHIEGTPDAGGDGSDDLNVGFCFDDDDDSYSAGPNCPTAEDCDDTNDAVNPGATEVCDGLDNDCDERVDEDLIRPCPLNEGVCSAAVSECIGGEWTSCLDAYGVDYQDIPQLQERCDGLDNNCSGEPEEATDPSSADPQCVCFPDDVDAVPVSVAVGRNAGDESSWSEQVAALVLSTIELDGASSYHPGEGTVTGYEWEIMSRPSGSTAELVPNSQVAAPSLFLDLEGTYTVALRVQDDVGTLSCNVALVSVVTVPLSFEVNLTWDTDDTDLDLHLLQTPGTWNTAPEDCYFGNRDPDWGVANDPDDDPVLDIDDNDGLGPETLSLGAAEAGVTYQVGVHYYADQDGEMTPTRPTIQIEALGLEGFEGPLMSVGDFWHVANIDGSTGAVEIIDNHIVGGVF